MGCYSGTKKDYNFFTAITQAPVLNLSNMGSLICNEKSILAEEEGDNISPSDLSLQALPRHYFENFNFDTIAIIYFNDLALTDKHIVDGFKKLPLHLQLLRLQNNQLTLDSAEHLIKPLNKQEFNTVIEFELPFESKGNEKYKKLVALKEISKKHASKLHAQRTLKSLERSDNNATYSSIANIEFVKKP
jgi:hypothetical protein